MVMRRMDGLGRYRTKGWIGVWYCVITCFWLRMLVCDPFMHEFEDRQLLCNKVKM